MKDYLVIEGVNLELLEEQRLELVELETTLPDGPGLEALRGIIGMLDEWSNKRYLDQLPWRRIKT